LELLGKPAPELLTALPGPITDTPGVPFGGLCSWLVPLAVLTADTTVPLDGDPNAPPRPALRADLVLRTGALTIRISTDGQTPPRRGQLRPPSGPKRLPQHGAGPLRVRHPRSAAALDPPGIGGAARRCALAGTLPQVGARRRSELHRGR